MGRYCGTTELRQYLSPNGSLPNTENGLLSACIDRAEDMIDSYTRRNFLGTPGTVYINRYSQGLVRNQAMYLDRDLHTLIGVVNGDGAVIPVGSCWLEPRNAGPPYRLVRLKSTYVWVWNTDSDVAISGTWGYGTVPPDDIVQATVRLSAWLYRQKDIGGFPEVSGFEQGGEAQFPRGIPDDVRYTLSPYRSRTGGVV